jgi:endonuclease/exonuclease/phosphatase family metal-dependent hydrolase
MSADIKVMTYNVQSCFGRARESSPSAIAEAIALFNPDIIALQELDVGLSRTGKIDQARAIAENLKMNYHFSASLEIEQGSYGNAMLSKYPQTLVKAQKLPVISHMMKVERRGALWTRVKLAGQDIQVLNTHLGLNRKEREAQIDELLGSEWLGHPECRPPIIFCGDLNALPNSAVVKKVLKILADAQVSHGNIRPSKTFPSKFPLVRIDYIFVSRDILVRNSVVPRGPRIRKVSDHLPLLAEISLPLTGGNA